ncbi:MAG TPA: hypothetical protein VGN57_07620 [Pirellulaceae bacterium]|jgi:hypothetical protein|nr:hypothetical protein [Pirellulaceae bacterium]
MSAPDARSSASQSKPAPDGASRRSGGSSARLTVLLLILFVAGIAAGWDYLFARPAFYVAQEKVEPLLPGSDADAEEEIEPAEPAPGPATQKDVHAALGLTPAATEPAGPYLVERYSWRRGIPWMTYDLWVIYDGDEQRTLRNATSVRQEADLYYATATPPAAPESDLSDEAITFPLDGPADVSSPPPAEAEADASGSPAGDAPDSPADDS